MEIGEALKRKRSSSLYEDARRLGGKKAAEPELKNAYQYEPLDEAKKEIRLMTLLSGKIDEPIRVVLTTTPFPANGISPDPVFEALSYVWGPKENSPQIQVESGQSQGSLSVTQNLAQALPYLRYPDQNRILWIDAICVNQQDLKERSKQVQRMGDIYSHAPRVVIWLGIEEENSSHALGLLSSLGTKIKINWNNQEISATSAEFHEWADPTIPLPYKEEAWLAIYKLLRRPWFARLWVQQEARLAKEATVRCGNSAITWDHFCSATFSIFTKARSKTFRLRADSSRFQQRIDRSLFQQRISVISDFGFYCNNQLAITFAALLHQTKHSECSDLRDKIFAVLGLISPTEREQWAYTPDYTLSIKQTYINAFASNMIAHQRLDLLRSCELGRRQHLLNLPSWAVDCEMLKHFPSEMHARPVDAELMGRLRVEIDVLIASGILVDVVDIALCCELDEADGPNRVFSTIQKNVSNFHLTPLDATTLASVLVGGEIAERWDPPIKGWPTRASIRKLIGFILRSEPLESVNEWSHEMEMELALSQIKRLCSRRSIIKTQSGVLGIAPEATEKGDVVVVIFGCGTPLVLRPVHGSAAEFQVVGECYADSIMNGEPVLGNLPEDVELIEKDYGCGYEGGYRNNETGNIVRDPRYEFLLGKDWRTRPEFGVHSKEKDREYWSNVGMECMKVRGVKPREFRIV